MPVMKLRDDELGGCGICHVDSTIETAKSREKTARKTVSGFSLYLGCHGKNHQKRTLCFFMFFERLFGAFVMQHHVFCFVDTFVCARFFWKCEHVNVLIRCINKTSN